MSDKYDWPAFYRLLCQKGSSLLTGVGEVMRDEIAEQAQATDDFWSEENETRLEMSAVEGDYRQGVIDALHKWRDNIAEYMESFPFADIDCSDMGLELETPEAEAVIEELVEATRPGG